MRIFIWVDTRRFEVGSPAFFHCFFSTIAYRLEGDAWGSRFPTFMLEFYKGRLATGHALTALEELAVISNELELLPLDDLVWDFDDLDRQPPWEPGIRETLTCAADCFYTPAGIYLPEVIHDAFALAARTGADARIERQF
jgi:hypothetical protein